MPLNNCCCISSCKPACTPTCPTPEKCLRACTDKLPCEDAVGPCGQTGSFDLSTLNHNTSGCIEGGAFYYILDTYDKDLLNAASIDRDTGILTWITSDVGSEGKYAEVCFILQCEADCDNCLPLKSAGSFYVGIKDECANVVCDECATCNPCDGLCENSDVNLTLKSE